ncbi:MAG: hypothetical protein WBG42_09030 [Cryomorphaceae bacterium]
MKGSYSTACLALLMLTSCSSSLSSFKWKSERLSEKEDYYAAYDLFRSSDDHRVDSFSHRTFTETLRQFDEPSFCSDSLKFDAYRFLFHETFVGTTMLRVEKRNNHAFLYWQKIERVGPGERDEVTPEQKTKISLKEWNQIESTLSALNFWGNTKAQRGHPKADGSSLIIEGWVNGIHQILPSYYIRYPANQQVKELVNTLLEKTEFSRRFEPIVLPAGEF